MAGNLILALPSKGRLQEMTHAFFARAGLTVKRPGGDRNYRGALKGVDGVEIAFLSASEIAREIAAGTVHFGITGTDLVNENIDRPEEKTHIITALGFGHADVVIAVPTAWIDVSTMADLADVASDFRARHGRRLRIATKYVNHTRQFFAANGIADYRIVESAGATEGAPAAGSAELVVDITSTGSTLKANNLKIPEDGVIARSQAHLVASTTANWDNSALQAARLMLDRITAQDNAHNFKEMRTVVANPEQVLSKVAALGCVAPFGVEGSSLVLHCPASKVPECADKLRAEGAQMVTVTPLEYVFHTANPLFEPLEKKVSN
ncbi:ATP phosphoribosyltransferase [Pseudovibrio axinellae]|uniref:ATP phosphoribosyltransferase n=1 Tax=Pseudovibrio axinellae TaxID=989403 RepID=A0A165T645_9HYPH|nr:ATP phosphoribosyltransferase [Pseudovibrio axinellae]KZL05489.1 ATP phosphoribosyltransferase [Pseudovibrio axinellae]SEP97085.1 ATP phosphoribosyltransferase [Pseudovibrio axinellae]